jgi:hypothetical protein
VGLPLLFLLQDLFFYPSLKWALTLPMSFCGMDVSLSRDSAHKVSGGGKSSPDADVFFQRLILGQAAQSFLRQPIQSAGAGINRNPNHGPIFSLGPKTS